MRDSSIFWVEAGISTSSWPARIALRIRVRESAMGAVCIALPARLGHAGDVALVGCLAQADPAEAEFAVIGARATAATATVVLPAFVLGFAALSDLLGSLGHLLLALLGGALAGLVALGAIALVGLRLGV